MEFVKTDEAPAAVGPYSQAVKVGDFVYISGQLPLDPITGTMSDDVRAQTDQAMKNILAILKACGLNVRSIVKTTIYIKNMDDFPIINEVYESHLGDHLPARACVEVARLPKDAKLEIEAIAVVH